jgi:hypothetical protein
VKLRAGGGGRADIAQVFLDLLYKGGYTPECKISSQTISIEQNRLTMKQRIG